jgi:carbonic anhydrase/acetyltransferase-like protein (isoleucine patch superfamily)
VTAGHLALGIPARVVRPLTAEESRRIVETSARYVALKKQYRRTLGEAKEPERPPQR